MSQNRETIQITTPVDGQTVTLKSWLTAKEKREISGVFLKKAQFNSGSSDFNVDGEMIDQLHDTQITTVVVSIDENTENVLDRCLDMKVKDYEFVLAQVEKIVNPEEKKS